MGRHAAASSATADGAGVETMESLGSESREGAAEEEKGKECGGQKNEEQDQEAGNAAAEEGRPCDGERSGEDCSKICQSLWLGARVQFCHQELTAVEVNLVGR